MLTKVYSHIGDEEYYDEGEEELHKDSPDILIEEDEDVHNKPIKDEINKENGSLKYDVFNKKLYENSDNDDNQQNKKKVEEVLDEIDTHDEDIIVDDMPNQKLVNNDYKINNIQLDQNIPESENDPNIITVRPTSAVPNTTNGFDVLTMNAVTMVENDNFKEFIDSGLIDNTEMLAVLDLADHATVTPEIISQNDEINKTDNKSVVNDADKPNSEEKITEIEDNSYDQIQDEQEEIDDQDTVDDDTNDKKLEHTENEENKQIDDLPQNDEDVPITETSTTVNEIKPESATEELVLIHEVVSVVTTKSVINGTILPDITKPASIETFNNTFTNDTEGWFIIGSVQTSKSVSQIKPILETDSEEENGNDFVTEAIGINDFSTDTTVSDVTVLPDSVQDVTPIPSTESIIDKLDQLQSELSSSFLTRAFNNISDNIAVLTDMQHINNATSTAAPPVRETQQPSPVDVKPIRKFIPNLHVTTSTFRPRHKATKVEPKVDSELSALLPPGFKLRNYNRKTTTAPWSKPDSEVKHRNGTTGRSLEQSHDDNKIAGQNSQFNFKNRLEKNMSETKDLSQTEKILGGAVQIDISSLLPPGYVPPQVSSKTSNENTSEAIHTTVKHVDEEIKTDNKSSNSSIDSLLKNLTFENISSKLLPQGFNGGVEPVKEAKEKPIEKPVEKPSGGGLKVTNDI